MKDKDTQSEEFDARVERLLLGEHTEDNPEMAHRPEPTGVHNAGTYNVTFNSGCLSEWIPANPLAPPYHIGDAPWQTYYQQQPTVTYTVPALTEERVREIVREMFEQMIEPAAQRISERVKQMIESMDESE